MINCKDVDFVYWAGLCCRNKPNLKANTSMWAGFAKRFFEIYGGGMTRIVQEIVGDLKFLDLQFITRNNWEKISKIKGSIVVNCAPAIVSLRSSNEFIDCSVDSAIGKETALLQASWQFRLYAGYKFPMEYMRGLLNLERHIFS